MNNGIQGILLRIFLNETEMYKGVRLFEAIVQEASRQKLAGATVFRGIMGYTAGSQIQKSTILRLSENMPIVIEIVDTEDKIQNFMPFLKEVVKDGMVTSEKANIIIKPNIE